ncbi:hypothetical protein KM043_010856 [Ampulex compressa]|nr:hypothetical protein KM043_010856 [Ampulex compressa]
MSSPWARFAVLLLLALLTGSRAADRSFDYGKEPLEDVDVEASVDYRLPKTVYPSVYEIILIPDLIEDFSFTGVVKINATVRVATNSITLHCGKLNVLSSTVAIGNTRLNVSNIYRDDVTEKYTIVLVDTLAAGSEILIAFSYYGALNENMIGFYKSSYVDENGTIKWLAATQFQTTHARHAFPCFDEPSFKASFVISIQREGQFRCLSNMPLAETTLADDETYWDRFQQSIPMSTYLVAFIVSEFDHLKSDEFKVWARANAVDQAQYALSIGTRGLDHLSSFFDQEYQLPKMDMVAVPDFAAGAMENWGLVTYRETRMLYDEKDASDAAKQSVAAVIIHELTHMWFGNLVTPEWWGYLWLSEAFARYFQYFATAEIETSWNMKEQFLVDQHQSALGIDGIESSQPMTRNVSSQSQIGGMGDSITYSKGASIVRMMNLVFGSDVFHPALRNYLANNKKEGLGTPKKLWVVLQNEIDSGDTKVYTPVENVMSSWTMQPGFPVVSVSIDQSGSATFRQERFFLRNLRSTPTNVSWWVPITWASQKNPDFNETRTRYWFTKETDTIHLGAPPGGWVIFNVQSAGFYRVNYDNSSWYRIIDALNGERFQDIHVLNRAAILDDLLNLARAGLLDYTTALDGLRYVKRERNYLPLRAALNALAYLNRRFEGHEEHTLFKKLVMALLEDTYKVLGYEDKNTDDRLTVLLRRQLNTWACNLGHEGCVTTFLKKFKQWRNNSTFFTIKPNQRTAAYCTAIKHGSTKDWEFLWNQFYHSNCAAEQMVILEALGCSRNATALEKYLQYALVSYEERRIRRQDSTSVFSAVYNSGTFGAECVLDFVVKHHAKMVAYYGGPGTIASILAGASQRLSTQELVDKFENLIESHTVEFKIILKSLRHSLEIAKYELGWYRDNGESIISWIRSSGLIEEGTTTTPKSSTASDGGLNTTPSMRTTPSVAPNTTTSTIVSSTTPTPIGGNDTSSTASTIVSSTTERPSGGKDTADTTDYRLPTAIVPMKYTISVEPLLEPPHFTFEGFVEIAAVVRKSTRKIVLHSAEIEHYGVNVTVNDKDAVILGTSISHKYNFFGIHLKNELPIGASISIKIWYRGHLNREMRGFYRSSYIDATGMERWLAASHLEPVGARKMFPCFDEPALKATFAIRANVSMDYDAISNMPAKAYIQTEKGKKRIEFHDTPKMSTYLVALVVSDFASVKRNSTYNVWARPNAIDQAAYAHSVMEPLVKFYEKALGHEYQLPKLDMIALPDFVSGAMENWGLLTYKEKNLLYDEQEVAITTKQAIANVISHEISHQWFGDLVTPVWWKYLWLNEGFARYFQYFGTTNVETKWSLESQFVVDQLHSAFVTDASPSIHPMSYDVYSPTEIRSIFDAISYAKSGSVLRMVEKSIGRDVFYKALYNYLKARSYDVATPEDLFDALKDQIVDEETKNSIHSIMNTWTTQAGYPVVKVSIRNKTAHFAQKRFVIKNEKSASFDEIWHVPITWTSTSSANFLDTKPKYWLRTANGQVALQENATELLIFNVQESGYYRVNYEDSHWLQLVELLKSEKARTIHEINRASLIDDSMNLARADRIDYEIALSATQYLRNETDYIPWRAFFNNMAYLYLQFQGKDIFNSYKRYMTALIKPIYDRLGNEDHVNDTHVDKFLRIHVRTWACELNLRDCRAEAQKSFKLWKTGRLRGIPANYRDLTYCSAMEEADPDDWYMLWEMYFISQFAADKNVILKSLACTKNKELINQLLHAAITEYSGIRYEDSTTIFSAVYSVPPNGPEYVMDFIRENYASMLAYYQDVDKIKSIIHGVGKKSTTDHLLTKFDNFITWMMNKEPRMKDSLLSYWKSMMYEANWAKKHIPRIHAWFDKMYPSEDYRLPTSIRPVKYNLTLVPHFEEDKFNFEGRVQIEMTVHSNFTSVIVLNAYDLDIKKISIHESTQEGDTGKELIVINKLLNETTQTLSIYLKECINAPRVKADIEFVGKLNDQMRGFYRSYYLDSQGNIHWIAATHFEPNHARSAFPCFDEPALKATFSITIETPDNYTALSNMPLKESSPSKTKNRHWNSFHETVRMSSYLVAFVVSDFKPVRNLYQRFNVWGRPEVAPYGDYAQIAGMRFMDFLHLHTGFEYPLPKMDLIGIPDFNMGAMENWGLSTFREYALFYDKDVTMARHANYLTTTIAHELSHMWYGNLVTCDWWEYIWLNEGFAEYTQYLAADSFRPGHRFKDQFPVHEAQVAMQTDALETARPMNNPVSTPTELNGIFGTITYAKASSVLRMVHLSFDARIFPTAMHGYFEKHKYKTATPKDLWDAFDKPIMESESLGSLNISMNELMSTWTNKPGVPVVNATLNGHTLTLTQERFLVSGKHVPSEDYFWIPITITTASKLDFVTTSTNLWLHSEPMQILVDTKGQWFLLNIQQAGYYRVNYDQNSWKQLIKALGSDNFDSIHVINRAQIIDDLFNLARADYVSYDLALDASKYLVKEMDYLPWKSFFGALRYIIQRYEGHAERHLLAQSIRLLTYNVYNKLGFEDSAQDSHLDQMNREQILVFLCENRHQECISKSKDLFAAWRLNETRVIPKNARPAVYCTAVRHGTHEDWNFLWQQYLKTNMACEKILILTALGCSTNKTTIDSYIRQALHFNYTIRKQDVSTAFAGIYTSGQFGVNAFLEFLMSNYKEFYETYGNWNMFGTLFSNVASRLSTMEQIDKVEVFLQNNKKQLATVSSTLDSALKTARANYKWFLEHSETINNWLRDMHRFSLEGGGSGSIITHSFSLICVLLISAVPLLFGR